MEDEKGKTDCQDEITPEIKYQQALNSVADMRVRYPACIARIDEKLVKINVKLLKNNLRNQAKVNMRIPKYHIEKYNSELVDTLDDLVLKQKQHTEKLIQLEKLQKIHDQLKNDSVGRIVREKMDSEALLKRVKKNLEVRDNL